MMDGLRRAGRNLLSELYPTTTGRLSQLTIARTAGTPAKPAELYALLRTYYSNNGIYDTLARQMYEAGIRDPAMRGLRNPAFRVVEFYVASLWPGPLERALPIRAANERIVAPIEQVWTWSNWAARKQVFARSVPMLGDGFIKVVQNERKDRVYFQLVEPDYVTEFDSDERGYLTYCRIDVPVRVRDRDALVARTHTEVWSKEAGTFRRWEHAQGDRPIEELGTPIEEVALEAMGIDFVPVVHCKFRDVGEERGVGAYTLQLDKMDEANRKATRLGQQLFRHNSNTWVVESTVVDKEGRPLPALRPNADGSIPGVVPVRLGDDAMFSLPGGYQLRSTVPQLDYAASLNALAADMLELQQDLPEMAYWRITEQQQDLSGRALRVLLIPAMARAEEARANLEDALARADQMALTMGQAARLPGFTDLGSFDAGDFAHAFAERDVVPISDLEKWQAEVQSWTAAKLQKDAGVTTARILEERDYAPDEIAAMAQEREADQSALDEAVGALLDRQPGGQVPVVAPNGRPANGPVPPA